MSSAAVRSFDAIQRVRDELHRFAHQCDEALAEVEGEVLRVLDWVEHDRPAHWKERVRRAQDEVHDAKVALERCLMYPINDETPACAEEKDALKHARLRLLRCEGKQQAVREIARKLRHEMHEYKGRTAQLKRVIEVETPRAAAVLERSLAVLEKYSAVGRGGAGSPASSSAPPDETEEPS